MLGEVGRAVSSTLDLETVLTTIIRRANQLSGTDFGVIYEYDEATERFRLRATENLGGRSGRAPARVPPWPGVKAPWAAPPRRGSPSRSRTSSAEGAYQSSVREALVRSGHRALLAVPLLREDAIIGGLVVSEEDAGRVPAGDHRAAQDVRHAVRARHPERPAVPRDRGQGRGARGGQPPQVRVPRQHVPRAAHAAQRGHRLLRGAARPDVRRAERQAGRVPAGHPVLRTAPALADQRHPRPLQDRGRAHGARARALRPARRPRQRADPRAGARQPPRDHPRRHRGPGVGEIVGRRAQDQADPGEPPVQRREVHARGGTGRP